MMRIRLPPDLKGRIAAAARASNRSMNAEIVHALEVVFGSLPASGPAVGAAARLDAAMAHAREASQALDALVAELVAMRRAG